MNNRIIIMMSVLLILISSGYAEQEKFTISNDATIISMKYTTA